MFYTQHSNVTSIWHVNFTHRPVDMSHTPIMFTLSQQQTAPMCHVSISTLSTPWHTHTHTHVTHTYTHTVDCFNSHFPDKPELTSCLLHSFSPAVLKENILGNQCKLFAWWRMWRHWRELTALTKTRNNHPLITVFLNSLTGSQRKGCHHNFNQ